MQDKMRVPPPLPRDVSQGHVDEDAARRSAQELAERSVFQPFRSGIAARAQQGQPEGSVSLKRDAFEQARGKVQVTL